MRYLDYTKEQLIQRIEELEEQITVLKELAAYDGLTKISNQRTLFNLLESELDCLDNRKHPLTIALFDIDDFKKVNDSMGHVYGNEVLTRIAEIIQNNIRKTDIVGRYGGDEFMVIFKSTELEVAKCIADRIRNAVKRTMFTGRVHITISGGVQQHNSENLSDFINFADLNLYKAKKRGKDNIV